MGESLSVNQDEARTAQLRARLGLRHHGVDVEADLLQRDGGAQARDDGALLHLATRGDDALLRGAAGLVKALEAARDRARHRPLLVWSAGAGGLAEPLTLLLLARAGDVDIDVVASDVADDACNDARAAVVSGLRVAWLPRALASCFAPANDGHGDGHAVDATLTARLRVARGDLRAHSPAGPFDLVVCREVLHHYRPDIARQMLARVCESLDAHGLLMIAVVDALAVGLPIEDDGSGVVLVDRDLGSVRPAAEGAGVRPAIWTLCALLDADAATRDRAARLLALAEFSESARAAAAAALVAEGRVKDARALVAGRVDDEGALIRAVCDVRMGRHSEALAALQGLRLRAPRSWLCAWLLAELNGRTGRAAEARGLVRTTIELLEGAGTPAGEVVALLPELHPRHVVSSARELLEGQRSLWHRP